MRFSTVLLAPILAWATAAVVIPLEGQDVTRDLINGRATKAKTPSAMASELIKANKQGVPKFTLPAAPTKGKKVSRREPYADDSANELGLQKRKDNQAGLNEVVTGTAADTVGTIGLGPCIGVITTFDKVSAGKVNKIAAHLGASGGPAALTKMVKAIYSAAVEGGVWNTDLDAGHRPQIHVSYPDADAEVAAMVKDGTITQAQAAGMKSALNNVISQVQTDVNSICSTLGGHCYPKTRVGSKATGSSMKSTTAGAVTIDGASF